MGKRVLVGLGTIVVLAVALLLAHRSEAQQPGPAKPVVATIDSSALRGPRQPLFFRHDIHVGRAQMQCQYCHYSVAFSNEPGIPSMQTCMGCHSLYVSGSTPENQKEIKKLRDAWNKKQPVQWVRVYALARHVHYPHSVHIKALGSQACATCHGEVALMPQVFMTNRVTDMGFCISCHLERKVSRDCTTCHY